MKSSTRNRAAIILSISMSLLVVMCSGEGYRETGRYYNKDMKFSIKIPEGWEVKEGDGIEVSMVELVSPWENDEDTFSEYIGVDVEHYAEKITLGELFDAMRQEQSQEFPYFEEHERGDVNINGEDAKYILFDIGMEEGYNKVICYALVKGKRGYLISCVAEASRFDEYFEIFQETAGSFRLE